MPVQSRYPSLDLPELDLYTFLFKQRNRAFPDSKVIYRDTTDPSRQLTYGDVARHSAAVGQMLSSKFGIQKGDVVALFTPNDIDFPILAFGALSIGAIVSPANPTYTVGELSYQLKDCGARLVLAHYSAIETVRQAALENGIDETRVLLLGADTSTKGKVKHYSSLLPKSPEVSRPATPKLDPKRDLAFLVYSSGTTGRPKGVMLSHYNIVSNVLQITACEAGKLTWNGARSITGIPDAPRASHDSPNTGGDRLLACLPYFHIYGLTNSVITPCYNGITTLVMAKFDIEALCRTVQNDKVTCIFIVPPMALLLAKHPCIDKYDLSSIRMTNSGAAPLTRETQEAVFRRCGVRIKQGYGLSETSPVSHEQRWEDWDKKIGTIGRLQPNMESKICEVGDEAAERDADPKEVPTGQVGEIYMRGPNIFRGYWHNETATKECLSEDDWFRTGDVGYVDADGDFFITDRVKELIKYKGFQVAPAELEGYLQQHELVDDVVVVGVNSEILGTEVPRGYIVRKGGMKAVESGDDKRIIDWLAARTVQYKRLRGGLKFVETVPKSASGKLLRRLLKGEAQKEFTAEEKMRSRAKL